MSFLRRRSATPAGPDFDVLAMDPGDWPGNLGAGLLPAPDGTCQGVFLRYDLFGGRGPAMVIGNLPEGSPARDLPEGEIPSRSDSCCWPWRTTRRSPSSAPRTYR
ncbi:hypothetical protein SHKM778_39700 [Streptomyces sp. KM77-8]|uniref:Uncharacterized protein n=1 Tax=Streptomyces haneummycinicus TaxID=3074435 RepID=A0AAT9HJY5_9ACTN